MPVPGDHEGPVKVLYIMGAGRSGSTILDIVLGNHPEVESVGEMRNVTDSAWIGGRGSRSPFCACGRRLDAHRGDACPFWSEVRREWLRRAPEDVGGYAALQEDFERYRRLPRLLRERRAPSPSFARYGALTRTLFESIRAVGGKPVVVDSSKAPARALALAATPGVDLYAVHLVRDGRGTAASRGKALQKNPEAGVWWNHRAGTVWGSSANWLGANLASGLVRRLLAPGRSIRVRYEDFTSEPLSVLGRIGEMVGIDFAELSRAASDGSVLQVNHNVGGNRLRMSKEVRLRPEAGEWRNALDQREQRISWALMGLLMLRYGYKR